MSAKQDTIALLKDSISNLQENLLNDILTQLDIAELSEETYQLLLTKMKNSKSVDDNLIALISKVGEKITIGRAKTFAQDGSIKFKYSHTIVKDNLSKLVVITSLESGDNSDKLKNFGKQLSMHIAASNPLALSTETIDKGIIDKESDLINEELSNTGKPDDIVKKISIGKMNKFKEENALLTQDWVMEPKKKVKDIIKELDIKDLKIKDFFRLKIGE